jgi:hypothetical protein
MSQKPVGRPTLFPGKAVHCTFRLPAKHWRHLDRAARRLSMSRGDVLCELIQQYGVTVNRSPLEAGTEENTQ